ncbi:hypothetical protein Acor_57400 [Acrocarpospora corrugata]|uniref:non-specific serine/threonine protein kinase n=1 Tax=Acrocarpospora corrugata TaxID=35763 RepID=A0A5M3W4H2_9ACTN|nr:protein kinase [Acrocarpospora corrugata]GES03674.1 hypothetical protein Acor_57400 [Acrocarpospora corrugata]
MDAKWFVDRERARMFEARMRALAGVSDPNVLRLREYLERPGRHGPVGAGVALVTDLTGEPMRSRRLAEPEALAAFRDVLSGLAAAHAAGVVHGDLRETDVLVRDGRVQLTGFGMGLFRQFDAMARAPELWDGGEPSPASDVYAATCLFFEWLTGRPPYAASHPFSAMGRHRTFPIPVEAVPGEVRDLVTSGLAKDPADRRTAAHLAGEVGRLAPAMRPLSEPVLPAEHVEEPGEPVPVPGRGSAIRAVILAATVMAVLVGLIFVITRGDGPASSAAGAAASETRTQNTAPKTKKKPSKSPSKRPAAVCPSRVGLTVSPRSGGPGSILTVRGRGVVPNGRVQVYFHASSMGFARTTADGCFRARLPIPNAGFFAHFPGQRFSIRVTEFDAGGAYRGNGPGEAGFTLT